MMETANGRKLAALMPRDRIVSESDGPFAKVQGAIVMPWDANTVALKLSELWHVSQDDALFVLRSNGLRLMRRLVGSESSDG